MRAAGGWYAPPASGGIGPDVEVQAVQGHPWAGVGVLLSPRGMDESQAGVPRAGGVEEVDQGVAPPGVVGELLLAAAIVEVEVEVFIGALVEAFPHRHRVVVDGEGVAWPWCPCHGVLCGNVRRHVARCRSLAVRSLTMLPGGDCSWTWAALGHAMGLYSPTPRAARARGMRWTQSPPARVANSGTG